MLIYAERLISYVGTAHMRYYTEIQARLPFDLVLFSKSPV